MRNVCVGIIVSAIVLAALGCRSKLDVQTQSGDPLPVAAVEPSLPPPAPETAEPLDVAGGLAPKAQRTHFQTRDTIGILVDAAVVDGADSFSLLKITDGQADPAPILDHEAVPDGFELADGRATRGVALAPVVDGSKMILAFHPGETEVRRRFGYGLSRLKLLAHDAYNPRFAVIELTQRDFDAFGPLLATAADPSAAAAAGFQGWLAPLAAPSVSAAGGSTLTTGMPRMVNPN